MFWLSILVFRLSPLFRMSFFMSNVCVECWSSHFNIFSSHALIFYFSFCYSHVRYFPFAVFIIVICCSCHRFMMRTRKQLGHLTHWNCSIVKPYLESRNNSTIWTCISVQITNATHKQHKNACIRKSKRTSVFVFLIRSKHWCEGARV